MNNIAPKYLTSGGNVNYEKAIHAGRVARAEGIRSMGIALSTWLGCFFQGSAPQFQGKGAPARKTMIAPS